MIINWPIFITLSPLFLQNDLEYVNFMPSFMFKVRKWMEDFLRIQKIIGHFMIFCQLQQCHSRYLLHAILFGQEQIPSGRLCLDARHYRSLLKKNLKYSKVWKVNPFSPTLTQHNFQLKNPFDSILFPLQSL